jgi:putative membrane protein insertion efficiency factor
LTRLLVGLIRAYQLALSPAFGPACRFHPSCSSYAIAVIERDGPWRGGLRALRRLGRCHPWGDGGLDLP